MCHLKFKKVRPALIVSSDELKSDDVILAFISSIIKGKEIGITDLVLKENDAGFKETGLKVDPILKSSPLERFILIQT